MIALNIRSDLASKITKLVRLWRVEIDTSWAYGHPVIDTVKLILVEPENRKLFAVKIEANLYLKLLKYV